MRILFATKVHLPTRVGGGQLTVHHLARALGERGHSVTVLAHEPPTTRANGLGYPVVRSIGAGVALPSLIAETQADAVVVHAYHERMTPLAHSLLDSTRGLPAVLYLHDVGAVGVAADRHADVAAVAAVSGFLAAVASSRGARAEVIPPVIDARDYRVPTTRERVLFVNPAAQKGLYTALALAALEPEIPFTWARCWYLGRKHIEYVESEARRLDNVEFRKQTVLDPAALYGDARVLIVPSPYPEAYGRVAREALMSGIPVIAAAVGGLPESVGAGGMLIATDAPPAEWADTLRALWHDDDVYAAQVARAQHETANGTTSAAAVAEQFEELLERVV
jgi:glycosyltransferase involved in cell wall biosynthesis